MRHSLSPEKKNFLKNIFLLANSEKILNFITLNFNISGARRKYKWFQETMEIILKRLLMLEEWVSEPVSSSLGYGPEVWRQWTFVLQTRRVIPCVAIPFPLAAVFQQSLRSTSYRISRACHKEEDRR
jgi:hypothetical protein